MSERKFTKATPEDFEWESANLFTFNKVYIEDILKGTTRTGKEMYLFKFKYTDYPQMDSVAINGIKNSDGIFHYKIKNILESIVGFFKKDFSGKNLFGLVGAKDKTFFIKLKMEEGHMNIDEVKARLTEEDKMNAEIERKKAADMLAEEDNDLPF